MSLPLESSATTSIHTLVIAAGSLLAALIGRRLLHLQPHVTAVWLRRPVIGCIYTTTTSTFTCIIFEYWTEDQIHNLNNSLALRQKVDITVITDPPPQHHRRHGVEAPPTTPPPRRGRRRVSESVGTDMSDDSLEKAVAAEARHLEAFTFPTPRHHIMPASPADSLAPLRSPTSPTKRDSPLKLSMRPSQSPAKSIASPSRHQKRLSLNLPVQPLIIPPSNAQWYPGSPLHSPTHEYLTSPTAETPFLAKLAAQERRVLELRDELEQAEKQLEILKRQWALEEAQKKRADVRKVHQLRPLSATLPPTLNPLDEDGSSEWSSQEMERRKQLMSRLRPTTRKVFSGSRHMRTLSLLSPERGHFQQPSRAERPEPEEEEDDDDHPMQRPAPRYESASRSPHRTDDQYLAEIGQNSREDIIKTSKQMAVDIKEGFFTFIEDLRQATVGEEGVTGTEARVTQSGRKRSPDATTLKTSPRSRGGRNSSVSPSERAKDSGTSRSGKSRPNSWWAQPSDPLIDIASSFWRDHGVEATPDKLKTRKTPSPATRKQRNGTKGPISKPVLATPLSEASEGWAWDTPSRLSQTTDTPVPIRTREHSGSPVSQSSSEDADARSGASPSLSTDRTLTPRSSIDTTSPTSMSNDKDAIPWPALKKMSPSTLRRTASHLMAEWEKGLEGDGGKVSSAKEIEA